MKIIDQLRELHEACDRTKDGPLGSQAILLCRNLAATGVFERLAEMVDLFGEAGSIQRHLDEDGDYIVTKRDFDRMMAAYSAVLACRDRKEKDK